jgi:ATP/maltotriose-dependent transcriptional regulator MalT
MAGGIGGVIGGIGGYFGAQAGAAGSEAAAQGDFLAAKYYADAADIAMTNKQLSEQSTKLQEAQLQRKIFKATGTQQTQVAGANLQGGSAGDLMRESIQQGALAKGVLSQQGKITSNSYQQEADALHASEASMVGAGNAALASAESQRVGGFMSLLSGGVSLLGMF